MEEPQFSFFGHELSLVAAMPGHSSGGRGRFQAAADRRNLCAKMGKCHKKGKTVSLTEFTGNLPGQNNEAFALPTAPREDPECAFAYYHRPTHSLFRLFRPMGSATHTAAPEALARPS